MVALLNIRDFSPATGAAKPGDASFAANAAESGIGGSKKFSPTACDALIAITSVAGLDMLTNGPM
jgi:hypothetical protein